ncbi:MAG: hypothetical protein EXR67_04905 [Dehalococcoidia bacterium]|nr:hypothetical protein [Dehalococcoidia bacterium]
MMSRVKAFGLFWWDFLVGDAPELALGVALILGIAFVTRGSPIGASVIVTAAIMALLAVSTWRGRKH